MSLQAARQLLQELDVPTPPPTDSKRVCQVLKGLLESYEQKSEQARKFNDEAQAAMDLKLSFDGFAGGGSVCFGSNIETYGQLQNKVFQLRHRLRVVTSTWFHYEVYQHFCLGESRVFFTPAAELSASYNALVRENQQLVDRLRVAEAALQTGGLAAQQVAHLQQQLDDSNRVARGRILEDLKTRQYMEGLNLHNHDLVQKANFLAQNNLQLTQSVTALQQQLGQHQQAGDDAAGLAAGFGQPSQIISGAKTAAQTTPKPPSSTGTGVGGDGRHARDPATPADAIPATAASQSRRGAAFPSLSRLTARSFACPYAPRVALETDSKAEVVAAVLAADDIRPADSAVHPVAEALPLPGLDSSLSQTHLEDAQQPWLDADQQATPPDAADAPTADAPTADVPTADAPTADVPTADVPTADAPTADAPTADAPAADVPTADAPTADAPTADVSTADVPTAADVSWGGVSGNSGDCGGGGWSEDDDAADMGQAAAPAATKPSTFLEAACRGVIAEEVPVSPAKARTVTTAVLSRSARTGSAVLRQADRAASGAYAAQSEPSAAKRPQTVAADGWHEVVSKKSSKSAKHVSAGGKGVHNTAQPKSDVEQANRGAAKLTSTQKKRRAKLRRKAAQQSGMQLRS